MGYLRQKLTDWLPALLAAGLLLAAERQAYGPLAAGQVWAHEGICRELVAGTTEGRQALVGSGWFPPLPSLAGLPAAYLRPRADFPWAAAAAAAVGLAALFYTLWRLAFRYLPRPLAVVAWLAFLVNPGCRALAGDPGHAITVAAALVATCKVVDWRSGCRLMDLVKLGFALAALALCGFALSGLGIFLILMLPLTALALPVLRPRLQGVLALGGLPPLYALAVWCLMNWLILGDGIYPLRGVGRAAVWQGWQFPPLSLAVSVGLAASLLALVLARLSRHAAAGTAGLCGLVLAVWMGLLHAFGLAWAAAAAETLLPLVGMVACVHLASGAWRRGERRAAVVLASLPLALAVLLQSEASGTARVRRIVAASHAPVSSAASGLLPQVAATVAARTPYGRVFVCGYAGLGELRGARVGPFVPCLDLHLGALRRDYARQQLFLLLPGPTGRDAWESVYWRYDGIYDRGAQRALFAAQYGSWRLYEIVSAPTEDQLREWRRAPLGAP